MCWRGSPRSTTEEMRKQQLKYVGRGEDSLLLVWKAPSDLLESGTPESCVVIPILPRRGGLLIAIPAGFVSNDVILDAVMAADGAAPSLLGPSREFTTKMLEEDENGVEVEVDEDCQFLVVDVLDAALRDMHDYDPSADNSNLKPFSDMHPSAIIQASLIMPEVNDWLEAATGADARLDFYSAREEPDPAEAKAAPKKASPKRLTNAMLADQISILTEQVKMLASQQEQIMLGKGSSGSADHVPVQKTGVKMSATLPPVSGQLAPANTQVAKALALVGPPPKVKPPPAQDVLALDVALGADVLEGSGAVDSSEVSQALLRQSTAITSLVAHLAAGDPLSELGSASSAGQSLNTRGVARREKLQRDLAEGTSCFFLQVQQQLHKKMYPARPVPKKEEDLVSAGVSLCSYLERFGGFKGQRDYAMIMWMLGHAMDAGAHGDDRLMKEYIALLVACLEQATLDGGWNIAYVLSLLEEPPHQIFSEKSSHLSALGRPFAPLVPPAWSAVALSYVKEMELLTTKKKESRQPAQNAQRQEAEENASPKRRPKFPKKPKDGGAQAPKDSK